MASLPKPRYTPQEYLALERQAEYKSEYFAGEIFAMAGASPPHNAIVFNLSGELSPQLRGGPCRGYVSDQRVKVSATGLYTYPDVVVVCGEPQFEDDHLDSLINPTLIIEVLSSTTEAYDRGSKFAQYRQLESFQEYVLIAQDECHVEWFVRQPDGRWLLAEAKDLAETVHLASIGCNLKLEDVYYLVELPPTEGSAPGGPAEPPAGPDSP
jgi:Uma2 family endonuclease